VAQAVYAEFWKQCAVLIVDSDAESCGSIKSALAPHCGLDQTAASAEAGGELLGQQHFDLIVADIMSCPQKAE
jgi:CheY-like chemotaxis protein